MGTIYVASSKGVQEWAADVGLGKNVYKVGWTDDAAPADAVAGCLGHSDWKVLASTEAEGPEEAVLERLGRKEKLVDPNYYPRLRGERGLVKVNLVAVENAMLVAIALENREPPKGFKVKPADIARHLINNATK